MLKNNPDGSKFPFFHSTSPSLDSRQFSSRNITAIVDKDPRGTSPFTHKTYPCRMWTVKEIVEFFKISFPPHSFLRQPQEGYYTLREAGEIALATEAARARH